MSYLPIIGFDNYAIDKYGRVINIKTGKSKSTHIDNHGYVRVGLNKGCKTYVKLLHRLIAECFIPNPSGKPMINHVNGIKHDNRIENLEWCTNSENVLHAFSIKLAKPLLGSSNPSSKLKEEDVIAIRGIYSHGNVTMKELGRIFKVDAAVIERVVNHKSWKHVK